MTCSKAIFWLLVLFLGMCSLSIQGQVNIKAGYSFSLVADKAVDDLIKELNQGGTYSRDYKNLGWLHGFDVGLRFKSGPNALEISYLGAYRHLTAHTLNPAGGSDFIDKLVFDVQSAGLGYQLADEKFGLGVDVQYQWYVTRAKLTQPERKFKDVQEMWATKFYLMVILGGSGSVSAVIEPYYILPFSGYNAGPIKQYLEVDAHPSDNQWKRFGLSFLFYNGR